VLPPAWRAALPGWTPDAQAAVVERVRAVSVKRAIGPPDPFRALRLVAPDQASVVVFGQDPYPTPGHADGLAFSAGCGRPRSLARVFDVLAADRPGWVPPAHWALDAWARHGVLLLNAALTVELGRASSQLDCGWFALTSQVVHKLCMLREPPVFLLWGGTAMQFCDAARPPGSSPIALRTRHPSYDLQRRYMAEGSHFAATAISSTGGRSRHRDGCYTHRLASEGCPSG
jgi:uracil-DNA glycosylase